MAGSTVRRSAHSSEVSRSACWVLIRSVVLQFSPSKKGGSPVFATSCSRICRTGVSESRIGASPPMTLISTSPTATKSRTVPFLLSSMARLHSAATAFPRSCAVTGSRFSPPLQMTL